MIRVTVTLLLDPELWGVRAVAEVGEACVIEMVQEDLSLLMDEVFRAEWKAEDVA